jgi:ADP-glucose type glycogen/starch synthase
LRVLFASAEAYPFAKVGGLGDVGGALPKALARRGHELRLVLPGYPCVGAGEPVEELEIEHGGAFETVVAAHHGVHAGVEVFSLCNAAHFGRPQIYAYEDDASRFTLFSKAVSAFAARPDWQPDVIHVNDWHLGLVPQHVREGPHREALAEAVTVLTIHNLAYQGPQEPDPGLLGGLNGDGNLLARGIGHADAVSTVSRRYLREILTPEHGMGLDGVLRSRQDDLFGITNGIDYEEYDPAHDPHLPACYDAASLHRRTPNKLELQARSGLACDPDVPLLGMVARLVDQKGLDLLCSSVDELVELGAQVVVVGLGETRYEQALATAASAHPGAIAHHADAGEALARLVYAGSDLFLAPSNFEPCGLGPLIAMRYGAVPVVRRTGGLADNIPDYPRDPEHGLGFTFVLKYSRHLVRAITAAIDVYRDRLRWRELQRRVMAADRSWDQSVLEYEQMYLETRERASARTALAATAR